MSRSWKVSYLVKFANLNFESGFKSFPIFELSRIIRTVNYFLTVYFFSRLTEPFKNINFSTHEAFKLKEA